MTALPRLLAERPRLDLWLDLSADGVVTVSAGKAELGQGILTAFAAITAHELDVAPARIRVAAPTTDGGTTLTVTAGSMSVAEAGAALRQACAEAREVLLAAAAARLETVAEELDVDDGRIRNGPWPGVTYWDLGPAALLACDATGKATPKPPESDAAEVPRIDLPDKVFGRPRYVHDLRLPGQLYGRVVHRPFPGARLTQVDLAVAGNVVAVVREEDFLGVVAQREEVAVRAADALAASARWDPPPMPTNGAFVGTYATNAPFVGAGAGAGAGADLREWLRGTAAAEEAVVAEEPAAAADRAAVATTVSASYSRPFLSHAAIGPSCAVARWGDRLEIWSHTQGAQQLRLAVAPVFGLPAAEVLVHHVEGAGCYGHNGADDVALDAALLARAVPGRPVQVVWSRADELGAAPLGPAMVADLDAGVDADGRVRTWRHTTWSQGHVGRPGPPGPVRLLGATERAGRPMPEAADPGMPAGGSLRNADPIYAFPARRVTGRLGLANAPRTSALRSLGAFLNVFAIECFMNELAAHSGADPLAYRLAHLTDPRARAVLERAAATAGWDGRTAGENSGYGIAVARYKGSGAYCAVVAEVEAISEVRVRRLVLAVDVGRVISRDGVANQIEGGAVQATSWTLLEAARLDEHGGVVGRDWPGYPILRFSQVPAVQVEIIDRPGEPSVGAGEAAAGPTAAAIAGAVHDALGVPVRDLPLTPDNIVAALNG